MSLEVIGRGMLARAFALSDEASPPAIICASGVADSRCTDELAFKRERSLVRDLAERARIQGGTLVYFSGAPVYGGERGLRVEDVATMPETPYGRHKLECERLVIRSGARHLVLRLPNIVGPVGHPHQLVPSLVSQVLHGSVVVRTGATRDLLDVEDLVLIVNALLHNGVCNTVLNVASGVSTPIEHLVAMISRTLVCSPSVLLETRGDSQRFSIVRARSLLSEYPQFEPDYPDAVLRRRVPDIARTLRDGA